MHGSQLFTHDSEMGVSSSRKASNEEREPERLALVVTVKTVVSSSARSTTRFCCLTISMESATSYVRVSTTGAKLTSRVDEEIEGDSNRDGDAAFPLKSKRFSTNSVSSRV
jgi:hypothetical protein